MEYQTLVAIWLFLPHFFVEKKQMGYLQAKVLPYPKFAY